MTDVYQFSICTGASKKLGRNLEFVRNLGMPLDITAISKKYDNENACVTACIHFLNKQNKELPEGYQTAIESNPFLSGESGDMSQEELDFNATRWTSHEIMKIISFLKKEEIPIQCSIYKTPATD